MKCLCLVESRNVARIENQLEECCKGIKIWRGRKAMEFALDRKRNLEEKLDSGKGSGEAKSKKEGGSSHERDKSTK